MTDINNTRSADGLNDQMTESVLPVTVFIAIEAIFGFFGNILILLVYSRRYRRINFRYFVLALAIVDFTSCCTTLPGEVFSQLNWYHYEHGWICKVKSYFNVFTAWASATILLSLAIDRYRKICHPFHWQISFRVAFRLCGCCFLASALVASPVTVLWGKMTYNYQYHGENVTVSVCEKSGDYADTLYPLIFVWCVYLVPVSIMIFVAMTLNVITARKLFGRRSTIPNEAKKHPAIMTSTAMTTESFDRDTDVDSSIAVTLTQKEVSEKHTISTKTGVISGASYMDSQKNKNISKNPNIETIELTITRDKDDGADCKTPKGISTDHVTNPKDNPQFKYPFADIKKNKRKLEIAKDNISTDDEISIGYFSGNTQSEDNNGVHIATEISKKPTNHKYKSYRKSKTMIMLILTSIFAVTMASYIILTAFVARPGGILKYMPGSEKAVFFFFWRLYFINSVVNPILYGFMDARFRDGLKSYLNFIQKMKVTRVSKKK